MWTHICRALWLNQAGIWTDMCACICAQKDTETHIENRAQHTKTETTHSSMSELSNLHGHTGLCERHTKSTFNFMIAFCPSDISSPMPSPPLFPFRSGPLLLLFSSLCAFSISVLFCSSILFFPWNPRKREEGQMWEEKQRSQGRILSLGFVRMPACLSFGLCCTVQRFIVLNLSVGVLCHCLFSSACTFRCHFGQTSRPKAAACWGPGPLRAKHRNARSNEAIAYYLSLTFPPRLELFGKKIK